LFYTIGLRKSATYRSTMSLHTCALTIVVYDKFAQAHGQT